VLAYLTEVAGDFSIGWWPPLAAVLVLFIAGCVLLWRRRHSSAALVLCAAGTPALAMLLARLGSSASPESRHLIFVLPFFATAVGASVVAATRRWGLSIAVFGLLALVIGEVAWAYDKTPQLFTGDPAERTAARSAAADWLVETSRPDDIFFGYEPVYLTAWEHDRSIADVVIPRADAKLAATRLNALPRPLGRGVWVFDAYDTNNCRCARRLTIDARLPFPSADFEARTFGPYLIVRTRGPTDSPRAYLEDAAQVMLVGKSLAMGDADINFVTIRRAADRLRYLGY
jgi:hypothetical protein